jgi:hypothetical protein
VALAAVMEVVTEAEMEVETDTAMAAAVKIVP